jgi:PWWP domain
MPHISARLNECRANFARPAPTTTAQTNGASSKKKDKRKSATRVPEHKSKKLSRKKSEANMHLDVEPGEFWFVQMKGYPPWPAVICDEDMLPITLLEKRPVSAKQVDGTYRADYAAGGKNQKDRRYPVMFLGTNEL